MRAIIVDDEALARRGLQARLAGFADIELVGSYGDPTEALAALGGDRPEVAFLDIEMPELSGLELAEALAMRRPECRIVFVTAYDHHAVAAFEQAACDYLLKPVDRERLAASLERVREAHALTQAADQRQRLLDVVRSLRAEPALALADALAEDVLSLTVDGERHRLPVGSIESIEAAGDYMCVRAGERTFVVRETLAELLGRLGDRFVRIHRSTAVNRCQLRAFVPNGNGDGHVQLRSGRSLRCSRTHRKTVLTILDGATR